MVVINDTHKKWIVNEKSSDKFISNNLNINPIILNLLISRGFHEDKIWDFLESDYKEGLHDPFMFQHMPEAVNVIFQHLQKDENITIYGDYDADGVTSAAVMYKALNFLIQQMQSKSHVNVYIPHRESEGYGVNTAAVNYLAEQKTKLIITVDTGIRSIPEIALAKKQGISTVLTDHHEPGPDTPDAVIINPKLKGETYPFRDLAGVGVSFKLAQGLLHHAVEHGLLTATNKDVFEKWILDLVAIGTIADIMPLIDENRVIVRYGLLVLNKTKNIGLQQLIKVAQSAVDNKGNSRLIDSWQVGYQLAPRLNAAGRLDHANNAYQLLISDDFNESVAIASELNKTNQTRQQITKDIFDVAEQYYHTDDKIILAIDKNVIEIMEGKKSITEINDDNNAWPSGIVGLVAGRLTEKYYRPALVITLKKGGTDFEIVGSGRSISEFDITSMLEECKECFVNYGGHKQACGFTVKNYEYLEKFISKAKMLADKALKDVELIPSIQIDMELTFQDIDHNLLESINKLRPFGQGNSQPKFLTRKVAIIDMMLMGNGANHLKLRLKDDQGHFMEAIAFNITEEWKSFHVGDIIDIVYFLDKNEWNGQVKIQLKIIDLKINNN